MVDKQYVKSPLFNRFLCVILDGAQCTCYAKGPINDILYIGQVLLNAINLPINLRHKLSPLTDKCCMGHFSIKNENLMFHWYYNLVYGVCIYVTHGSGP